MLKAFSSLFPSPESSPFSEGGGQCELTWLPSEQGPDGARATCCGQQDSRIPRGRPRPGESPTSDHIPASPVGRYISRCPASKAPHFPAALHQSAWRSPRPCGRPHPKVSITYVGTTTRPTAGHHRPGGLGGSASPSRVSGC